jgi:Nucleotidyltransferase of unknown function (DUF6036)
MRKADFDHVIAAAVDVSGEREIVVIGSQAILGSVEDPPEELVESMEVDVYPLHDPDKAEEIDTMLGDGSSFHGSFGFYAHGVGPETMKGPAGWEQRLIEVKIQSRPAQKAEPIAYCLELHDLVLAKCAAARERDWDYAREMLRLGLVDLAELLGRVDQMPVPKATRELVERMLRGIAFQLGIDGPRQPDRDG